jgi:hypothetical protein
MSKSGRGNPPKHSRYKKGVSGNPAGRPPNRKRKAQLVRHIISKVLNASTNYREGGRTKRASRPELALKKLLNSALEGDARSAEELFKLRAKVSKSSHGKSQKFIIEDWIPDFEGQTGEQKTDAHARENAIDPTGFWRRTGSETPDRPSSVSASPKAHRDE